MLIEVSIGESLDKITILEIKLSKIQDITKKKFIQEEFDYLKYLFNDIIVKHLFYYKCLKKVNLEIWEVQDLLRLMNPNDKEYGKICETIFSLNDSRFFIKNKINILENSKYQEQKGYKKRIANFIIHNEEENKIYQPAIRLLSTLYDELRIFCIIDLYHSIKIQYSDDPTIIVNELNNNLEIIDDIFSPFDSNIKTKTTHTFLEKLHYKFRENIELNINNYYRELNLDPIIYEQYSSEL